MKKLFSFISVFALVAILGVSSVSAQKTTLTVEKLWSITEPGGNAARQGFGMDGALYYHQQGAGVYKVTAADATPELVISKEVTGIGAHSVAKDDAGNIVVFGSASFPTKADSELFIYVQKKGEATGAQVTCPALEGFNRTDFIAAAGDVFSAEGGHLYLINNDGKAAYDVLIVNGATATVTPITGMTLGASANVMMDVHDGIYHYASAGSGIYSFDGTTATKVEGLTDLNIQCVGATHFTLAGKELWVYHVGTNYSPEFKVLNKTDNAFVTDKDGNALFVCNDASKIASGGALRGVWTNVEKIDDNSYMLYVWHAADGGAVYKVSATVAATVTLNCDAAMGSVEGAGDVAVGANATVKAIPNVGYSFVAWMNGTDTVATTAEYTFEVKEDVTLTAVFQKEEDVKLTLAVNDATLGTITLPEGIVLGENTVAYGTKVALAAVPVEGCTFLGWYAGDALYAADYTIEVAVTADLALTAKFVKVLKLEYDLGGGVTNDYGWTSKGALMLDIQNDYNAAYNASLNVVKEENGVYYFNIKNVWMTEQEAQGQKYDVEGFFQNKTWSADYKCAKLFLDTQKEKYAFLVNLIDHFMGTAVAGRGTDSIKNMKDQYADAYIRADVSGFMLCSPASSAYPCTCDWTQVGQPNAFVPVWKHAFANPTEIVAEVVLNAPYKEGLTFNGWYTNPEFTGDPVVTVSPESVIEGGKLYAQFIEYIPTIAEVRAMEEGTETKVKGIVNHVGGNTIYIEDASGFGMDIYMKNSGLKTGQEVVVKGTFTKQKGWPRLEGLEVVDAKDGKLLTPVQIKSLAELVNDTTYKYYARRVAISGLKVSKYDNYGNAFFTDGTYEVQGYYMELDQTIFPVGSKVVINGAVAAWYGENFQFTGDVASVTPAPLAAQDTYQYPDRNDGKFTLVNDWIFSNMEDNFADNKPGTAMTVRGMAAKDGKMYFISREKEALVVVDGATGKMEKEIKIVGEHLFQVQNAEGAWASSSLLPFNDIKFDTEGNCLIGGCPANGNTFIIYKVDLTTGEATEVIKERIWDNANYDGQIYRCDAFGVYGDVTKDAVIMAADAGQGVDGVTVLSWNVFRWQIKDGVAGKCEMMTMPGEEGGGWNTAPQIFPQDTEGKIFYVDGFNTLPTLYMAGADNTQHMLLDEFNNCPTKTQVWNQGGDTINLSTSHNGMVEFQVGEEYFLMTSATYITSTPASTFALFHFANSDRLFSEMEPLWYFPAKGMGSASNQCRTAVPSVEVIGNTAKLYLYTQENGYGVYTLTVKGVESALENIKNVLDAKKVIENGQVFIIKNGVKYNVLGTQVK